MKLWRSTAEDSADGESSTAIEDTGLNPPKGEGCEYSGPPCLSDCCTGCCWQPPTDFCASRWALAKSALSVLTEPLFDVFSIVTFLKNGQPFYFLVLIYGFGLSSKRSGWDGLQAKGAIALVKSWHRGFPTKELLLHKRHDLPENILSTSIQLFACLTLSPSDDPWDVISLGVFAWLSLCSTLADEALWLDKSLNYEDFHEVERAKKEVKGKKYVLPVVLVAVVQCLQMIGQMMQIVARSDDKESEMILGSSSLEVKVQNFLLALEVLLVFGCLCRVCYSGYINGWPQRSVAKKDEQFGDELLFSGCAGISWLFLLTIHFHVKTLVAQWEWIREIWNQSTWPPKLEVIAAMMQWASRTAGLAAFYAMFLGHYWLYYVIFTAKVANTEGESYEPLVENHHEDPEMVKEGYQCRDGEAGGPSHGQRGLTESGRR